MVNRAGRDEAAYFVWVRGLSGPEPQRWASLDFGINGWKRELVLAYRALEAHERGLSLAALARRYPPPRQDA